MIIPMVFAIYLWYLPFTIFFDGKCQWQSSVKNSKVINLCVPLGNVLLNLNAQLILVIFVCFCKTTWNINPFTSRRCKLWALQRGKHCNTLWDKELLRKKRNHKKGFSKVKSDWPLGLSRGNLLLNVEGAVNLSDRLKYEPIHFSCWWKLCPRKAKALTSGLFATISF